VLSLLGHFRRQTRYAYCSCSPKHVIPPNASRTTREAPLRTPDDWSALGGSRLSPCARVLPAQGIEKASAMKLPTPAAGVWDQHMTRTHLAANQASTCHLSGPTCTTALSPRPIVCGIAAC